MILGIGDDVCDIRRIEQTLERFGDRFLMRIFTEAERAIAARRRANPKTYAATLAKRFAAKEAIAKALGTGFARGVFPRDLGVVNPPGGQPTVHLGAGAAARLGALTPRGMTARAHLTMTDEYPRAEARVILEAVPNP